MIDQKNYVFLKMGKSTKKTGKKFFGLSILLTVRMSQNIWISIRERLV